MERHQQNPRKHSGTIAKVKEETVEEDIEVRNKFRMASSEAISLAQNILNQLEEIGISGTG